MTYRGFRYRLVEADGKQFGPGGLYAQRPAAIRQATRTGLGVYDAREKETIHKVDHVKRLEWLRASEKELAGRLADVEARISTTLNWMPPELYAKVAEGSDG